MSTRKKKHQKLLDEDVDFVEDVQTSLQTQLGQSICLPPDGFPSTFLNWIPFTQAFIGSPPEALKGKINTFIVVSPWGTFDRDLVSGDF